MTELGYDLYLTVVKEDNTYNKKEARRRAKAHITRRINRGL